MASVAAPVQVEAGLFAYAVASPVERFRANRDRFIQAARSGARLAETALPGSDQDDDVS